MRGNNKAGLINDWEQTLRIHSPNYSQGYLGGVVAGPGGVVAGPYLGGVVAGPYLGGVVAGPGG